MILIEGSRSLTIRSMSVPARLPAQPLSADVGDWKPPWWMTRTGRLTPFFLSSAAALLAAWASSVKVNPLTPDGVTMVGVSLRTSPMTPTPKRRPLSPRYHLTPYDGNSVPPLSVSTFAERYWKKAPGYRFVVRPSGSVYGAPTQPSGEQPPCAMRSSSAAPLSNSWLPTEAKSARMRFVTIVAGSSLKRPLTSGEAPMLSPARTDRLRR